MSDSLRDQLESVEPQLDLVKTRHLVMLQKTSMGPVIFLFEHRKPKEEPASLRMETVARPHFEVRLYSRQKRLLKEEKRQKYRFTFRQPKSDVVFPADAKSAKGTRWSRIDDEFYERLRQHDTSAWEELFCDLLDIGSTGASSKSGKG